MSTYLAKYLDSIPLGYSITQMQNALVGHLTDHGWQLLAQSDGNYSDLIPPSTESIGTTKFREVTRIYFPTYTSIVIGGYQACIADAYPQSIRLTALTAGAVTPSVTIGGVTVSGATGSSSSTANDNLLSLYYALRDSANATITGWDHWYNGSDTIICTNKTIASAVTCSATNVTYTAHAAPVQSGALSGYAAVDSTFGPSVTIDLTNGFVYYMSIFSRTFTLATKCISGVFGPIFASYIDHDYAVNACPTEGWCTPIELTMGDSSSTDPRAAVRFTHGWSFPTNYTHHAITNISTATIIDTSTFYEFNPWTGHASPTKPTDHPRSHLSPSGYGTNSYWDDWVTFGIIGLEVSVNLSLYKLFKVLPLAYGGSNPGVQLQNAVRWIPPMQLPDIFKWIGASEPNETACLANPQPAVGVNGEGITLEEALDASSTYSTLLLSTVTGLDPAGVVIIKKEAFTYTGISGGNTLTGVSRGANGTTKVRHFVDDQVEPGTWFMKLNGAAMCCGPTQPS